MASFIPILSPDDIQRAAELIQQAYAPQNHLSSGDQKRIQQELFEIQKRQEAWGLVIPFLDHSDPNVQFFGAHTAQVKIARDWASFPEEHAIQLRDMILDLTGRSMGGGKNKVILRKLYVAITSLALKLAPGNPSRWPDWLLSCINAMSGLGATNEQIMDFLAIVAEEVESADLLPASKIQVQSSLRSVVPIVAQAITSCIDLPQALGAPHQLSSALKCLQSWLPELPANDLTPLIPPLIELMSPTSTSPLEFDETAFVGASETLQELMSRSALAEGSANRTLTEPLLIWCHTYGGQLLEDTLNNGFVGSISHSFCKLLAALGDHSTLYLAANIASTLPPAPFPEPPPPVTYPAPSLPDKSQLVQTFLRLLLAYAALPGFYGVDEEESELTLGFWYLFQEALWNAEYEQEFEFGDSDVNAAPGTDKTEQAQWRVARIVYLELVQILRHKVVWPDAATLRTWNRDQRDKFQAYRRDVGDILINAYYILRDDVLAYYVTDILQRLSSRSPSDGWEDIEGTLHCVMAVQEAVPVEDNPHLARIFGPQILDRLPVAGSDRVRRTALLLIGSYASWFTTLPKDVSPSAPLLMNAVSYIAAALPDPVLCLPAANALRDLCDANRAALAPHIGAFGGLHASLTGIPDTEKAKVLQSIASVIQALPPLEEIPPIEAILNPVVAKLHEVLQSPTQLPEEARAIAIQQLVTVTGVAKGLTRTTDSLLIIDETPEAQEENKQMVQARDDPRMSRLREGLLAAIRRLVDFWTEDAIVSDGLSELIRAITALPTDLTLISLPAEPLLESVCVAAQKQLTAVWLSLTTMLIIQLDPPSLLPTTFKSVPTHEARQIALNVLGVLLQTCLSVLGQPEALESNPDIVQAFFGCMDTMAQHFVSTFYQLPPDLFNALMQCSVTSLGLQERYSLVGACTFIRTLIIRTCAEDELTEAKLMIAQTHGCSFMKAVLNGFAGVAPRSAAPNLIELLSTLTQRFPAESRQWMTEVLFADGFVQCRANAAAKEQLIRAVFGSRSMKRVRDAAQQFILVARGLEGTGFGYTSVTM
ncbi:ARM repeat-containing protein [Daedalea quercina L-15889]|uniref:ARM repeat-containing protein n=1 Tax=Daedalea quercina L-15889 TaxID=1314783 RepID=A0A165PS79_9APHY|nr:ARM repeat-containing protein [Daedalea quercina L-15889]